MRPEDLYLIAGLINKGGCNLLPAMFLARFTHYLIYQIFISFYDMEMIVQELQG